MAVISTNVPQPTFGPNGFIVPTDDAILTGVLADLNQAFGGNLNTENLETPQGQLASSEAAIIAGADQTFLFYTQQTDPAYASGRMQDAIGRIYFIERLPAQQTTVSALCTGAAGTNIPLGALAADTAGNTYLCTNAGTIPVGGFITLPFSNTIVGPVPCPAGSLTTIYKAIPGWDTITNSADGVIGQDTETRQAFETRRAASVAQNSVGSLPSVQGAVLNVPGVLDAYVTENPTASPATIGGVSLAANSLYVAAIGGDSLAMATAIWSKKAPGCAYNGNTTVTVTDSNPGYSLPYPTYSVTFEIPSPVTIYFQVNIINSINVPSNAAVLIQNAILNAFSGDDGGSRARIGSNILASRYYAAIASLGPWAQIESLYLGSIKATSAVFTASITDANMTVSAVSSGTLAVGQILQNSNAVEGTTILSQTSGSPGSTGVYVVSIPQTVGSGTFDAVVPALFNIQMNINEVPVTAPAAIFVSTV